MSSGSNNPPDRPPAKAAEASTALDVLPPAMIERASAALEGIVEPENRAEVAERVLSSLRATPVSSAQMQITATHTQYVGRFPPADMIAGYEQAKPGLGERVIAMGEVDQSATIASNTRQQWFDFAFKVFALLAGVCCLFGILWYVAHLASGGHDGLAGGVLAAFGTGLIVAIINARLGRTNASNELPPTAVIVPTDKQG